MLVKSVGVAVLLLLGPAVLAQKPGSNVPEFSFGPYLQSGSCTSVVVRWKTVWSSPSLVRFGTTKDHLDQIVMTAGKAKDHVVLLGGLVPNTRYYYRVGRSAGEMESKGTSEFLTSPSSGSTNSIRVWVLGDAGTGSQAQRAVRDAYYKVMGSDWTDLVLALGDNAYGSGTLRQYRNNFFGVYRDLFKGTVVWPTLGNHDAKNASSAMESGVYYSLFTLPRLGQCGGTASGTAAYYSFTYGNAHFICLNSEDVDLAPGAPMISWLQRDLRSAVGDWTICFWHQCPYTKGTHDSDSTEPKNSRMHLMREQVLPVLEAAGVDLVLCGHTHVYERSFLLHGHYGPSQTLQPEMIVDHGDGRPGGTGPYQKSRSGLHHLGTVYVNTGSAGHATPRRDLHGLNYSAMCVSLNVPGSVAIEISGRRLTSVFWDERGRRQDWFRIEKQP